MADENSWRTTAFRQSVVAKIDEAIRQSGMNTSRNSLEMENHVYQKAKNKEEYLGFVARLILHVREMKPKQGGTMAGPGQGQTGPGMPDPINALQNLASQGSRNPMMNMGPQPGQMGGPPQQPTATNLLQTLNRGPSQQMMMGSMPGNMPGNMPMQDRQAIGMPPGGGPMAPNQIGNQMANEMRIQQMRNTGINQMPNQLTGHVTNQMQSPVQNQICGQMPGQIPGQMQMGNTMASQIQSQMMEVTEVHNSEKEKPKETISSEQLNKNTTKQSTIDPSPGCSYKDENSSQVLVEKIDSDNPQKEEVRRFLKSLEPKKKRARKTVSPSKIQTPSGEKNENLETEKTDQLLQQLVEKEDTTIKFAKYIAEKLNQFNSETKAILTHKINLLIFEAEVKPGSISSNTCSCVFNQPSTSSFVPVTSNGQITNSLRSAPSSLYNETPNPLQIIPPPPPPPPNNNHIPNMLPTPVYSSPNIQTHSKLQLSPYVHVSNALPTTPLPVYNTQATTASRSVPILSSNIQTTSATPMPTPPKIRPVSTLQLMSVRPPSLLDTIPLPLSITPTQNTFQSKPHTSELQSPLNSLNIQIPTTLHSASPLSHDNQDPSPMNEVSTVTPDYPSPSLSPSSHSTNSIRSIYSSVVHSSPEVPFSSPSMSPTSNPSTPCSPSEIISVD